MGWQRPAALGALVGLGGAIAFFLLHAVIVEPIWRPSALARAAVLAPLSGALLAVAYARLRERERWAAGPAGGLAFGALVALALAPFLAAGWLRTRGAPPPFWALILALLLLSFYGATQAVQARGAEPRGPRERLHRLVLPGALLAANALPAWFLTFISDFHEETPEPLPMTLALAGIYLACGAAMGLLLRTRVEPAPEP